MSDSTWLSSDADKGWSERVLLAQSPLWMVAVAVVMLTGWVQRMGDVGLIVFSIAVSSPAVVVPYWLGRSRGRSSAGVPYWVKVNLFCAVLVVFGTYFGTHYFFDLMGMRYAFGVEWFWSSEVVGRTPGRVPVFMYPLTQAYFVTYYVVLTVAWRGVRTRFGSGTAVSVASLFVLSYAVAFAETFFMAADVLADVFRYEERARMLRLGSIGYAVYFLVGVPMLAQIDEPSSGGRSLRWSVGRTLVHACAACLLILVGLEVWAKLIGPL